MKTVGVVLAARNEEKSIPGVLAALENQTLRPTEVVVVDDGSRDRSGQILEAAARHSVFKLTMVNLPYHEKSYVGLPELAAVFNSGLKVLRDSSPKVDFVMILGGDHLLPPNYLQKIVEKFEADPFLAVAGGRIANEPYWEHAPRGSSMLVRFDFWEKVGGVKFPVDYGWESWLYLKALQTGRQTRSFKDVPTTVSRRTSATKGVPYGRAMFALGYYWPYALGRCALLARRSPRSAVQMFAGYLGHGGVKRLDVADWVGRSQRRTLVNRAALVLLRRGRR
ncbi:MAG: glycosyltransferase family 2 protein [Thaumarchaeota archaeon]|nr:glycosyltransferase family 2 protein [Nitrososphaerota archaeon]